MRKLFACLFLAGVLMVKSYGANPNFSVSINGSLAGPGAAPYANSCVYINLVSGIAPSSMAALNTLANLYTYNGSSGPTFADSPPAAITWAAGGTPDAPTEYILVNCTVGAIVGGYSYNAPYVANITVKITNNDTINKHYIALVNPYPSASTALYNTGAASNPYNYLSGYVSSTAGATDTLYYNDASFALSEKLNGANVIDPATYPAALPSTPQFTNLTGTTVNSAVFTKTYYPQFINNAGVTQKLGTTSVYEVIIPAKPAVGTSTLTVNFIGSVSLSGSVSSSGAYLTSPGYITFCLLLEAIN